MFSCQAQTSTQSTWVYKNADGVDIEASFYHNGQKGPLQPLIIWMHPGALLWGSKEDLPGEQLNFYLEKGYAILAINYRLAPATKLVDIVTDVKDAIQWARSNGKARLNIDQEKIFLVGHSAGAYLALLASTQMEKPPNAIISFYGY